MNPADDTQPTSGMSPIRIGAAEKGHTSPAVALRSLRHHMAGTLEALNQVLEMLPAPPRGSGFSDGPR